VVKHFGEIAKLSSIRILSSIFSLALPFYEASPTYRIAASKLRRELGKNNNEIKSRIQYLKKLGYIESFVEGKERFYEITLKGQKKLTQNRLIHPSVERPAKWDGKWRVIIFDIPNKFKSSRDVLRLKLIELGCQKVQESVYVFPFECTSIITDLSKMLCVNNCVVIMISEIIQGEESIIENFLDNNVLVKSDLRRDRNK